MALLCLLVFEIQTLEYELAERNWVQDSLRIEVVIFRGKAEDVANKSTNMEVRQLLELIGCQHISQEAEYLHVSEFNVILTLLLIYVVEIHYAFSYTQVTHLL